MQSQELRIIFKTPSFENLAIASTSYRDNDWENCIRHEFAEKRKIQKGKCIFIRSSALLSKKPGKTSVTPEKLLPRSGSSSYNRQGKKIQPNYEGEEWHDIKPPSSHLHLPLSNDGTLGCYTLEDISPQRMLTNQLRRESSVPWSCRDRKHSL